LPIISNLIPRQGASCLPLPWNGLIRLPLDSRA
jgi:hypothetical protein